MPLTTMFFLLFSFVLLFGLLGLGGNVFIHFGCLSLFLAFLGLLSSLHLSGFSLPFDHLISNDINGLLVVDGCCDVILEFLRVTLAIEVGIEEDLKVPVWRKLYSALSFSKVSLCLTSSVRMNSSTMKLEL